jgi:GABA permease
MWFYPGLTYATIAFIVAVLVLMLVREGHRLELGLSLALAAVILAIGVARGRGRATSDGPHTGSEGSVGETAGTSVRRTAR